jgi:hypothetical protein
MLGDLKIVGFMSAILAVALVVGFSFPALTERGAADPKSAQVQETVANERERCKSSLDGVDCGCYAQKAGYLKTQAGPKAAGGRYVDQTDLARSQAASGCRK